MSKQIQSTNKKSNKNIFFVVEGEFDMTKLNELPFGIVDYCLSFLTARDKETGLPSEWFQEIMYLELKNSWNRLYVPVLRNSFEKMTKKQLVRLTDENCYGDLHFDESFTKKYWIDCILRFPKKNMFYTNYKIECIERILLSRKMSPKSSKYLKLDPFANAKITLKNLRFKELGERQAYCVGCGEEIDFSNKYWCSRGDRYWCVDCDPDDN